MRRKHWALGTALVVLAFLAAACGGTDGSGSSGGTFVQSPVRAAVAATGQTQGMDPATMVVTPQGVVAQGGTDAGMVLGRSDTAQQSQMLQQGEVASLSGQATASASDHAGCGAL